MSILKFLLRIAFHPCAAGKGLLGSTIAGYCTFLSAQLALLTAGNAKAQENLKENYKVQEVKLVGRKVKPPPTKRPSCLSPKVQIEEKIQSLFGFRREVGSVLLFPLMRA